jgi:transcriptional regulator with XRE-family HTH domain
MLLRRGQVIDPLELAGRDIDLETLIADPPHNHLGTVIRAYRTAREVSQQRLSSEMGVSPTHMSDIERGLTNPSYRIVLDVWKALGVDPTAAQALVQHLRCAERTLDHLLLQKGWGEFDRSHLLRLPLGTRRRLFDVLQKASARREMSNADRQQRDPVAGDQR